MAKDTAKLTIRPLTLDLWPAFAELFGKTGACNGCWCMYWRIGAEYTRQPREKNRAAFRKIVKDGPPPGLMAFDGDLAVGWCQLTPRDSLAWLNRARNLEPVDDVPVWSISCFYVRSGYRGKGVTSALINAALKAAKRAKAPALEAYPVEAKQRYYMGYASTFARAGFKEVARRKDRPVMRHDLKTIRA